MSNQNDDCGCSALGANSNLPSYLQQESATDELGELVPLFIENNGFFPNVDVGAFIENYSVDKSIRKNRLMEALSEAVQVTNGELLGDVCRWQRSGFQTLESVPQDEIEKVFKRGDGEKRVKVKRLIGAYLTAVHCKTMEFLNERYRSTDTKKHAVSKAENMEIAADNYEESYRLAIYTLTGREGSSVFAELI